MPLVPGPRTWRASAPCSRWRCCTLWAEPLPPDVVVVEEALSSNEGVRLLIPSDDAHSFYAMRGGGIGWALPAAIGIKLGLPHRPVIALVGDGGSLYTIQALWTAAHERVPVVAVVLNNRSYRILKQRTRAFGGHSAATGKYLAWIWSTPRSIWSDWPGPSESTRWRRRLSPKSWPRSTRSVLGTPGCGRRPRR